jgi:putative hydrolase of the HAD superfamily
MIQNVLFDLGNVLVTFDRRRARNRLAPFLPPDKVSLMRTDEAAFSSLFRKAAEDLETGRIDFEQFHLRFQEVMDATIPFDAFRVIYCDMFQPDDRMITLGRALSRSYAAYLVSNTSRVHYEWIVGQFPDVRFYRDAALSFEIGAMKPSPAYYERALSKFGIEPAQSVFIDDLPENVQGATEAGMTGIVFRGIDDLVIRLADMNVLPPANGE